jgi:hypothetical protein
MHSESQKTLWGIPFELSLPKGRPVFSPLLLFILVDESGRPCLCAKGVPHNDFLAIHYPYCFRHQIGVSTVPATVVWTPIVWDSVENQVFDVLYAYQCFGAVSYFPDQKLANKQILHSGFQIYSQIVFVNIDHIFL